MNARHRYAILLSAFAIAGCGGGARLDATTKESYTASLKAMTADMTDNQKRQFAQDTMTALGPEAAEKNMKRTFSKDKSAAPVSEAEMYQPLQGLTVEEIQAKAEAIRQQSKKK